MKQAADFIARYGSFVITAHKNPDGDAAGSAIALGHILREAGNKALVYLADPVPRNTAFLPGADQVVHTLDKAAEVEAAIVLDSGDLERPGPDFAVLAQKMPVLNLDHHKTNTQFGQANWVDPQASSTGEMIARLAKHMGLRVSADAALCLFTALLTDTGSFQFSNVTPESLRMAADMVEAGARPELASDNYYHQKPASHLKLLAEALATLRFNKDCTVGEIVVSTETFQRTGTGPDSLEGVVNMITDVDSAEVAVLYRQTGPSQWKVSMRSKGNVDVAAVAAVLGGGGHKNAAGATIDGDLESVKSRVSEQIEKALA